MYATTIEGKTFLLNRVVLSVSFTWRIFKTRAIGLPVIEGPNALASHADVLRGLSCVPAPRTSADLNGKKRRPITADFQIWEVHFGPWEISRFTLSVYISRKDHKSFMKTEDLTVLEQTTQLTHKRLYLWLPSQSHWKKLSWGLNLLNGRRLYYKTITCHKKILPFVQSYKITPPLHHLKNNFTNKWHQIQPPQREIYKNPTLLS